MNEILKPKALWERGIPLQSAWEKFASQKETESLQVAEGWLPQFDGGPPSSFWDGVVRITGALGELQSNIREGREVREAFEDRILDELFDEELYGFGYPVEPSPARMPRRIDPAFWDGCEVAWGDGKAWLDNLFFNRIRIVDPNDYPQFDLAPKRPGPISHADKINWAISHHAENNDDFWEKGDAIRIGRMRKSINDEFGIDTNSVRGFSDKTFEKYILEFKKANS